MVSINRGANGFLIKDNSLDTLVDAITCVNEAEYYFNKRVKEAMNNLELAKEVHFSKSTFDFSVRELDILRMICNEMTSKEISEKINIGQRTVETHRTNIISKIGCRSTAGIVHFAIKNKLCE